MTQVKFRENGKVEESQDICEVTFTGQVMIQIQVRKKSKIMPFLLTIFLNKKPNCNRKNYVVFY